MPEGQSEAVFPMHMPAFAERAVADTTARNIVARINEIIFLLVLQMCKTRRASRSTANGQSEGSESEARVSRSNSERVSFTSVCRVCYVPLRAGQGVGEKG